MGGTTTDDSISFACPLCERVTRVPASFGGKQGKCPGCRATIEVPDPKAAPPPDSTPLDAVPDPSGGAPSLDAPPALDPFTAVTELDVAPAPPAVAPGGDHRACTGCGKEIRRAAIKCRYCGHIDDCPCPRCGEKIKATAKKCRYCGEFLDDRVRDSRRQLADDSVPARRAIRFAAYMIDEWLLCAPYMALFGMSFYASAEMKQGDAGAILAVLGVAWWVCLTAIQWYRLSTRGQTIGKGWLGIQVVRIDGSPAGFVNGVILRQWILGAIMSPILSWIALMFRIIDGLLIFAEDRRCLHDYIASTRVIEVRARKS